MSVNIATSSGFLLNDDCMKLLQNMRSGTVECVFADPPFNLAKDYGPGVNDNLSEREYLSWTKGWLRECIRVLKPGGSLLIYNVPRWQIQIGAWLMANSKLSFRHWISVSMKNSPPRGTRLYPAHYGLLYFTKGEPKTFNKDLVRVPLPTCRKCHEPLPDWGGYKDKLHPAGVNLSDIWTDTSPVRHRRYKTRQKGVNELDPKIPERAILLTTQLGDIVLDPFGGGGTTYRMAERHGRRWLGAEIGDSSIIREGLVAQGVALVTKPAPDLIRLFKTWPDIWNEVTETHSVTP